MKKTYSLRLRILALVLAAVTLVGCSAAKETEPTGQNTQTTAPAPGEKQAHTVTVMDEKDAPLEGIGVYVYTDETQEELVWFDTTDKDGKMTFTEVPSDAYVAVLSDVPKEYTAEKHYPLTGLATTIRLAGYKDPEYKLGDTVEDFTVTDSEGKTHKLSQLLKKYKAVVLNFWYINCGPCGMEFPFMNEAYQDYRDKMEILAMSPIDKNEDIAAYKEENSLTFPMAECDIKWEKMMQLTGYPTTVVIDRNGVISFIHSGYIDNAQDFRKIFDFFTQEEYEPTLVESLADLPEVKEEEKGTEENPFEIGGVTSFEITVKAGADFHVHLYKAQQLWLQVKADELTITEGENKHTAKNGSVSFLATSPDTNSPLKLVFTNHSKEDKTYTINLSALPGSFNNPYPLELGEVAVTIYGGNEQGVYYTFRPTEDGVLTLKYVSGPAGVGYDCVLNRIMAGDVVVVRSMTEEGSENTVSTPVKKGESVKLTFSTLPDATNSYPGGNFVYLAEFTAGEVKDEEKTEELEYTVTVKDDQDQPVANVNMSVWLQEEEKSFATSAEGVAVISLPKGTYTITIMVPEGYTLETTSYILTEDETSVAVTMTQKVVEMVDYTLQLVDARDQGIAGVLVRIGTQMLTTDDQGRITVNLEKGSYTAMVMTVPAGFVKPTEAVALPEDGTQTKLTLEYIPGSVNAPIDITETPYLTASIPAGQSIHYRLHDAGNMVLTIASRQAAVAMNGTTYGANSNGIVRVELDSTNPVLLEVFNVGTSAGAFTLELSYPVGSAMNPQKLTALGVLTTMLEEKHTDGWYYTYVATESGTLTFGLTGVTNEAAAQLILTNTTSAETKTLVEDAEMVDGVPTVAMEVALGDVITIQVCADVAAQITTSSALTPTPVDTRISYTVTLVNQENQPQTGLTVSFRLSGVTVGSPVAVNADGVAQVLLEPGTYTVVVNLPDDALVYDQAAAFVTAQNPNLTVVLSPKPDTTMDYTVHLTRDGVPYTGEAQVQILDSTDAVVSQGNAVDGMYTARLEAGSYTVALVLADDTLEYASVTLTQENPEATVVLTTKVVVPAGMDYTVTVLNSKEVAQPGVWVQVKGTDYLAQTDDAGVARLNMPAGTYNVELIFPDKVYYYNESAARLTQVAPNLTITLAAEPAKSTYDLGVVNYARVYDLNTGITHIKIDGALSYYSDEYKQYFVVFTPTKAGTYRVTLDRSNVELGDYNTPYYVFHKASASDYEDNALTFSVQKSQAGNLSFVLGIAATEGVTDVAVTITRVGEPGFSIEEVPFDTAWKSKYVPKAFTLPAGKKLTYVDVMKAATEDVVLVYNEADQFYHWGSANGPVVYLDLSKTAPYYSFDIIINGDGAMGGSPIRAYFYTEKGEFIKKEDYTDTLLAYMECADPTTGVYPLTKDLAYILQNGCKKWWTPTDPAFEGSALKEANLEIAWLFACCYIAG
ncbi:MAG: redoxin domain-containing protein [Ruminococcaceae bacterium]|nr:redoxin domain-containing protein [Oscillospiraceae bacterium]